MSTSSSRPVPALLVARLRAAGCVFAEEEASLLLSAGRAPADLAALVDRRVAGEPLEHVLGWAAFCGLRVAVEPGVFVPRHRTEFLVQEAAALLRDADARAGTARALDARSGRAGPTVTSAGAGGAAPGAAHAAAGDTARMLVRPRPVVVDLCCGSGAVAAALLSMLDGIDLHAVDVDAAAVRCARRNLGDAAAVHEGDLCGPLPAVLRGRVDVLVANAPYVPTAAIGLLPPEARLHEPWVALDGGPDGVEVQRRVAAAAACWLAPGGHVLVETSEDQAPRTAATFAARGLVPRVARCEDADATVVIGTRAG